MLKPVEVEEQAFRAAGAVALIGFAAVEARALCFRRFGFGWQQRLFWWPCKNLV